MLHTYEGCGGGFFFVIKQINTASREREDEACHADESPGGRMSHVTLTREKESGSCHGHDMSHTCGGCGREFFLVKK